MFGTRSKKVYYSDTQGSYIKDANTGEIYPWKLGSFDEKRLFKVKDNSLLNNIDNKYQQGYTMFFKDPYEYMKFSNLDLDMEIIDEWEKRQEMFI